MYVINVYVYIVIMQLFEKQTKVYLGIRNLNAGFFKLKFPFGTAAITYFWYRPHLHDQQANLEMKTENKAWESYICMKLH